MHSGIIGRGKKLEPPRFILELVVAVQMGNLALHQSGLGQVAKSHLSKWHVTAAWSFPKDT